MNEWYEKTNRDGENTTFTILVTFILKSIHEFLKKIKKQETHNKK